MIKRIVMILLFSFTAYADMMSFYKTALDNLQYDQSYTLYKQSNKTFQTAVNYAKFANFSADVSYSKTYAKLLPTSSGNFGTTDIALHDTLDLFGKNNYKIQTLRLDKESKKSELNLKKEQLFIYLANMIALYNSTSNELQLHQDLYNEQKKIYKKIEALAQNGDVTELEILRFKNRLTTLKTKIVAQSEEILKMKKQLNLYAPNKSIPIFTKSTLLYTKEDFLAHNPSENINSFNAQRLLAESKGMTNSYIPTVDIGVDYQKLDDPTSYSNNHSFMIALHMPINRGDFKEAEALKVAALSKKAQSIEYKLQRENEYIQHYQTYINAKKQLNILENALNDYIKSEVTIKEAYLKRYIDFNTYLQVLKQLLNVKKQIIEMKSQERVEATIINAISNGTIYE